MHAHTCWASMVYTSLDHCTPNAMTCGWGETNQGLPEHMLLCVPGTPPHPPTASLAHIRCALLAASTFVGDATATCTDTSTWCSQFKSQGWCHSELMYMSTTCAATCNLCNPHVSPHTCPHPQDVCAGKATCIEGCPCPFCVPLPTQAPPATATTATTAPPTQICALCTNWATVPVCDDANCGTCAWDNFKTCCMSGDETCKVCSGDKVCTACKDGFTQDTPGGACTTLPTTAPPTSSVDNPCESKSCNDNCDLGCPPGAVCNIAPPGMFKCNANNMCARADNQLFKVSSRT